jgi:hypothetical protein
VTALSAPDGVAAFLVETAEATDVAVLRAPNAPGAVALPGGGLVETDGELALVTLEGSPPIALVARGSRVEVNGEPRLLAPSPVPVLVLP